MIVPARLSSLKRTSAQLRKLVKENFGLDLKPSEALDVIASIYEWRSWNALFTAIQKEKENRHYRYWSNMRHAEQLRVIHLGFTRFEDRFNSFLKKSISSELLMPVYKKLNLLPALHMPEKLYGLGARPLTGGRLNELYLLNFLEPIDEDQKSRIKATEHSSIYTDFSENHWREGAVLFSPDVDVFSESMIDHLAYSLIPARSAEFIVMCVPESALTHASTLLRKNLYAVHVLQDGLLRYSNSSKEAHISVWSKSTEKECVDIFMSHLKPSYSRKVARAIISLFVEMVFAGIKRDGLPSFSEVVEWSILKESAGESISEAARKVLLSMNYDYADKWNDLPVDLMTSIRTSQENHIRPWNESNHWYSDIASYWNTLLLENPILSCRGADEQAIGFSCMINGSPLNALLCITGSSPHQEDISFPIVEWLKNRTMYMCAEDVKEVTFISKITTETISKAKTMRDLPLFVRKQWYEPDFFDFVRANPAKLNQVGLVSSKNKSLAKLVFSQPAAAYVKVKSRYADIMNVETQSNTWDPGAEKLDKSYCLIGVNEPYHPSLMEWIDTD